MQGFAVRHNGRTLDNNHVAWMTQSGVNTLKESARAPEMMMDDPTVDCDRE